MCDTAKTTFSFLIYAQNEVASNVKSAVAAAIVRALAAHVVYWLTLERLTAPQRLSAYYYYYYYYYYYV